MASAHSHSLNAARENSCRETETRSTASPNWRTGSLIICALKVPYSTVRSLVWINPVSQVFRDLLFRKRQCVFTAFDLLFLNEEDFRTLPLIERKAALTGLFMYAASRVPYLGA